MMWIFLTKAYLPFWHFITCSIKTFFDVTLGKVQNYFSVLSSYTVILQWLNECLLHDRGTNKAISYSAVGTFKTYLVEFRKNRALRLLAGQEYLVRALGSSQDRLG